MTSIRTRVIAIVCAAAVAALAGAVLLMPGAGTSATDTDRQPTEVALARGGDRPVIDVRGTVWVANEGGSSLTAIDVETGRVVSTVRGIEGPHNVQASEDGDSVWAVSGHDSTLIGIETETLRLAGSAATGAHSAHVVLDRTGARAFVSNSDANTVTAFDLKTMRRLATVRVGSYPHGMRLSHDGTPLMVANLKGSSTTLVDLQTMQPAATVAVGDAPVQVAFDRAGSGYVSLNGEDTVAKIDLATRQVVAKRATGDGPAQIYVTADGARRLVANQGTEKEPADTLSVFDTETMQLLDTVPTGRGPHGVTADPGSKYAFVTNMYDDDVAIVDFDALETVSRIKVGDMPNGISFSSTILGNFVRADVDINADPQTNRSTPSGRNHAAGEVH